MFKQLICSSRDLRILCCREFKGQNSVNFCSQAWLYYMWQDIKIWSQLKVISQTCSNDHLYKTTTHLRRPMLSPPNQILIQSLLYKTNTCLTRPSTTFFCLPNEKKLSKTTTKKLCPVKKWEINRQQYIKINASLIIFTLLLLYNAKKYVK